MSKQEGNSLGGLRHLSISFLIAKLAKIEKCHASTAKILAVVALGGHLYPYSLQTTSEAKYSKTQDVLDHFSKLLVIFQLFANGWR